jgi:hypothetical protein
MELFQGKKEKEVSTPYQQLELFWIQGYFFRSRTTENYFFQIIFSKLSFPN